MKIKLGSAVLSITICLIGLNCPAQQQDSAPPRVRAANVYTFQFLADFDCLDGVRVDRSNNTITLFGHRADASRFLRIAYFDYLAEALKYSESPTISLEPEAAYYRLAAAAERDADTFANATEEDIGHRLRDKAGDSRELLRQLTGATKGDFQRLFDGEGKLTEQTAWMLGQLGVPAERGLGIEETLSRILRVTGRDDTADTLHLMGLIANGEDKTSELNAALGIATAVNHIDQAYADREISADERMDEYRAVWLRGMTRALGFDSEKYRARYVANRRAGLSPARAWELIQRGEMHDDYALLMNRTFSALLKARQVPEIGPLPWTQISDSYQIVPIFKNVSADTWLARTLFQADLALKSIFALDSEIESFVPGFLSEGAFRYLNGLPDTPGKRRRATIVAGSFKIAESPDHNAIQFLDTPMKIEYVEQRISGDGRLIEVPNSALDQYSADVTSHFDALARVFPSVFKVREAAKIVAVARWLEKRGIKIELPAGKPMKWSPPVSYQRVISSRTEMYAGRLAHVLDISGGVDLLPERNWNIATAPVNVPNQNTMEIRAARLQSDIQHRQMETSDASEKARLSLQLAGAFLDQGDAHAAMQEIDRAVRLNPGNISLLLLAAQSHFDNGDGSGASQIMKQYLQADPENAPARRMLARFQQQPSSPPVTPFEWQATISRAVYAGDERAPDLPDIHFSTFQASRPSPPPPPPIPDCLQFEPQIMTLRQQREQLVKDYQQAAPERAPEIAKQIKQVDADVVKIEKVYQLD